MQGAIGNTDFAWYRFLLERQRQARAAGQGGLDEVNFWKPSAGAFRALQVGEPFFFKLKVPYHKIAGLGFFNRYVRLPDWLAWDSFGQANGNDSLESLRRATSRYRDRNGGDGGRHEIGCILLTQPVFFEPDEWVDPPDDWAPNIVTHKGYDLAVGEGDRVLQECLSRLTDVSRRHIGLPAPGVAEPVAPWGADASRHGRPLLVHPRLGQGTFRVAVQEAYGRACAVTGEHSLPVLEAAHIQPYAQGGPHAVSNGLFLRTDLHRLFDKGFVTFDDDLRFVVSDRLRHDYDNGVTYYAMQGQALRQPPRPDEQPDPDLLDWHRETVFLG